MNTVSVEVVANKVKSGEVEIEINGSVYSLTGGQVLKVDLK